MLKFSELNKGALGEYWPLTHKLSVTVITCPSANTHTGLQMLKTHSANFLSVDQKPVTFIRVLLFLHFTCCYH